MLCSKKSSHYKSKQKKKRIEIIISLYQYDFYQNELKKNKNPNKLPSNIIWFNQIIKNLTLIDNIIEKNLYNYKLNRLNKVDKAIIRLATAEFLKKKISHKITMNEIIELTKEYSSLNDGKQYKFTNKLLQLIHNDIVKNQYLISN
ncbi:MAG: transcription antitermination factor NusB [Vigna little leaf phytoplasma]|nr:transcription antitermination factor NusB [Vigna little leaf phytoplasma]